MRTGETGQYLPDDQPFLSSLAFSAAETFVSILVSKVSTSTSVLTEVLIQLNVQVTLSSTQVFSHLHRPLFRSQHISADTVEKVFSWSRARLAAQVCPLSGQRRFQFPPDGGFHEQQTR